MNKLYNEVTNKLKTIIIEEENLIKDQDNQLSPYLTTYDITRLRDNIIRFSRENTDVQLMIDYRNNIIETNKNEHELKIKNLDAIIDETNNTTKTIKENSDKLRNILTHYNEDKEKMKIRIDIINIDTQNIVNVEEYDINNIMQNINELRTVIDELLIKLREKRHKHTEYIESSRVITLTTSTTKEINVEKNTEIELRLQRAIYGYINEQSYRYTTFNLSFFDKDNDIYSTSVYKFDRMLFRPFNIYNAPTTVNQLNYETINCGDAKFAYLIRYIDNYGAIFIIGESMFSYLKNHQTVIPFKYDIFSFNAYKLLTNVQTDEFQDHIFNNNIIKLFINKLINIYNLVYGLNTNINNLDIMFLLLTFEYYLDNVKRVSSIEDIKDAFTNVIKFCQSITGINNIVPIIERPYNINNIESDINKIIHPQTIPESDPMVHNVKMIFDDNIAFIIASLRTLLASIIQIVYNKKLEIEIQPSEDVDMDFVKLYVENIVQLKTLVQKLGQVGGKYIMKKIKQKVIL